MRISLNPFNAGRCFATELQALVTAATGGLKQELHLRFND